MTATNDALPPMNHVFVDFENMHHVDLSVLGAKAVSFTLLLGAKQTKLDVALVEKLMAHAASVQLIRLTSSGKNALDFALAYYLGRSVLADPTAYFHVVAKDGGYDPLIEHLRSRGFRARRHESFDTLTFSGPPKAAATVASAPPVPAPKAKAKAVAKPKAAVAGPVDHMARAVERLRKNVKSRPNTKTKLLRDLKAKMGNAATDQDAMAILDGLIKRGHITIADNEGVAYHL